ncbi:proteasome-associated protein ECM29-like protein isoform X1 [Iris pallida]|uniref:Proteasome-associated protein ECM29-like protein isoform X1 n=1 Tax=Iris pallida TaxID=29817 RepID=A0AAX6GLU0_IRIPA|nr:proteasome-associated protein ECM29-like protein isoform X1 [Iris pallida]
MQVISMKVLLQSIERLVAIMTGGYFWSSVSIQFCTSQLGMESDRDIIFLLSLKFLPEYDNHIFFSGQWLAGLSIVQSDRVTGKLPLKGDALLTRKVPSLFIILLFCNVSHIMVTFVV